MTRAMIAVTMMSFCLYVSRHFKASDLSWNFFPTKQNPWTKIPKAVEAVKGEWAKLRAVGCWDEKIVEELSTVRNRARDCGTKIHVGRVFTICVEKHSELPPERRKYKGRVVFQGNNVFDESGLSAVFGDQGSSASFLST